MGDKIRKWLINSKRNDKISKSNKKFHKEHGLTRKVPVNEMGGTRSYIYLERRSAK